MRIIIHHRTQGRGVEAVHLLGVAKGFASFGHDVQIVSPKGVDLTTSNEASKSSVLSHFSRHSPEFFFEIMEIVNNFTASKVLERKRKSFGCDVLYERFALLNYIGARKAKLWGTKFVVEINYTSNSPLDIRKRTNTLTELAKRMEKITFDHADLLLPVSSTLASELKHMGYPKDKILVSPNAVDPDNFKPREPDPALRKKIGLKDGISIGYVGGFAPWHSLDILIEAIAAFRGSTQIPNLLLIGDGPSRPLIEMLRNKYRDTLNVVLPGRVDHQKLSSYLDLMDIMVMPNSNDYGSPMKVFEYMAMGKAVIAPDYLPVRDVVNDGTDGIIFKPNDARMLSEILSNLLSNGDLRNQLGRNARRRVIEEHNWKNRVRLITERLNSIA